jgi:hypothetical protein
MKVVNDEKPVATNASAGLPNGFTRVYNKLTGKSVDVHTIDALEYVNKMPHSWSLTPVAKEQAVAEDAVIVTEPEPAKEESVPVVVTAEPVAEPAPVLEDKPISARSRKLAKFD